VVLPALYLRHQSYFICTLITGFWVDATLGAPFGFFTSLFLVAGAFMFSIRIRVRPEHNYHPILLAHLLNLFFIAALTLGTGREYFGVASFWIQVLTTLFCSHHGFLIWSDSSLKSAIWKRSRRICHGYEPIRCASGG